MQVSDPLNHPRQVRCRTPALLIWDVLPLLQLSLDLLPHTDERYTIYGHHHSFLDNLPSDLSIQHHRMLDLLRSILLHLLLDHGCDIAVHARGALRDTEVDLLSNLGVSTKGGVVLETIARAVLMDREVGLVCVSQGIPGRNEAPCRHRDIAKDLPPFSTIGCPSEYKRSVISLGNCSTTHFQGALYAVVDIRQVILDKLYSFIEATLVEPA